MLENISISTLLLAAGALGTASFGIVEGLKWLRFVGEFGLVVMVFRLGALTEALEYAYGQPKRLGSHAETTPIKSRKLKRGLQGIWYDNDKVISEALWALLAAHYRGDRAELEQVLRQGVRIGLTPETAESMASDLKMLDAMLLKEVAKKIHEGQADELLTPTERNVLGKFELAADSRIEAALTLAQSHYSGKVQMTAAGVAILIAFISALGLFMAPDGGSGLLFGYALLIGILAVPVAPITHNLVDALKAVTNAIGPKL